MLETPVKGSAASCLEDRSFIREAVSSPSFSRSKGSPAHLQRARSFPPAHARTEEPLLQPTPVQQHFGKACAVSQKQPFVQKDSTSLAAVPTTLPAQSLDELLLTDYTAERPGILHNLPLNPECVSRLQATALFIKGILLSSFLNTARPILSASLN